MKKLFYLMGLCLLAVACKQSPGQFTLTASGFSTKINDIYVSDMANNPIDTIKVNAGSFTYTYDIVGEPKLLLLRDNASVTHIVVAEKGKVTLDGKTGVVKGSPLNDRLSDFTEAYRNIVKELEKKTGSWKNAEKEKRELTEEEAKQQKDLGEEVGDSITAVLKRYYEKDKGTVVGALQLAFLHSSISEEEFMALYEQGGEAAATYPPLVKMFERKKDEKKTQIGAKFIDFEGINPKDINQTLKLSDFAGKDKYILLDFWASWCGPCKAAMPEIKKLNDKYSGKGLEVIGVIVNDKLENHLKSAEALDITWTQIFDNKDELGTLYGIKGIPTLILLDKDGTILVRTNNKGEVVEKIESLLGK